MSVKPVANPLPGVPLVESPLFESLVQGLPADVAAVARSLNRDGFAVVDFPEEDFAALAQALIARLEGRYDLDGWRQKKERGIGEGPRAVGGLRIQDVDEPIARRIASNPRIIDLLSQIYGRPAFPFQTLNFPVGTEQHFHTDSVHFSCIPERFMCGVWVALEDVGPEQGPLTYYPGSHTLPIYGNEHFGHLDQGTFRDQSGYHAAWERIVAELGFERRTFHPRRGQALIWAANLLHGGDAHLNPNRTRWSQVTHYYFEDCVYLVPMHSDLVYGQVKLKDVTDLRTGKRVEHSYLGKPLPKRAQALHGPEGPGKRIVARLRRRLFGDTGGEHLPAGFDGAAYLDLNPDVKVAGADPAEHYLRHGRLEGRPYRK